MNKFVEDYIKKDYVTVQFLIDYTFTYAQLYAIANYEKVGK